MSMNRNRSRSVGVFSCIVGLAAASGCEEDTGRGPAPVVEGGETIVEPDAGPGDAADAGPGGPVDAGPDDTTAADGGSGADAEAAPEGTWGCVWGECARAME